MGIGTATGIFIAKFSDMWQFIWRRAPDFYQRKEGGKADGSTTGRQPL